MWSSLVGQTSDIAANIHSIIKKVLTLQKNLFHSNKPTVISNVLFFSVQLE